MILGTTGQWMNFLPSHTRWTPDISQDAFVCWELELMDGSVSVTEEMLTGDDAQTKADAQVAKS